MCSPNPGRKGPTGQFLMSRARQTPWPAFCWVVPPCQPTIQTSPSHSPPLLLPPGRLPCPVVHSPPSATPRGVGHPSPPMHVSVTSKVGLAHLSGVACHTLPLAWYLGRGAPPSFTTGVNRWSEHGQKGTISEVHSSRARG